MKRIHMAAVLVLGVLLALPSGVASPQSPVSAPEGNADTAMAPRIIEIYQAATEDKGPAVAYASDHAEFLTVWYTEEDVNAWGIWGRRVGVTGEAREYFNIMTTPGKKRWDPVVAYSPVQDEYLVAYTDQYDPDDYDILARTVRWDGGAMGLSQIAVDYRRGKQERPAITYNSHDDEYLVVYQNWRSITTTEVVAARVAAGTGTVIASAVVASSPLGDYRGFADVAYNPAGNNYLVVYGLERVDPLDIYIGSKLVSADLQYIGSEMQVSPSHTGVLYPSVAAGPNEFLVTWCYGGGDKIEGRRASAAGDPIGPQLWFAVSTYGQGAYDQRMMPDVAYSPPWGYLAVWEYRLTNVADGGDTRGRYLPALADPPGGAEMILDGSPTGQYSPAVACTPNAICLVAEEHNPEPYPAGSFNIRGILMGLRGAYLPLVTR